MTVDCRGVGAVACNLYITFELQYARVGVDVQRGRRVIHTDALWGDRVVCIGRVQGHVVAGAEVAFDIVGRVCCDREPAAEVVADRDAVGVEAGNAVGVEPGNAVGVEAGNAVGVQANPFNRRQSQCKAAGSIVPRLNAVAVPVAVAGRRICWGHRIRHIDQAVVAVDIVAERDRVALGIEGGSH